MELLERWTSIIFISISSLPRAHWTNYVFRRFSRIWNTDLKDQVFFYYVWWILWWIWIMARLKFKSVLIARKAKKYHVSHFVNKRQSHSAKNHRQNGPKVPSVAFLRDDFERWITLRISCYRTRKMRTKRDLSTILRRIYFFENNFCPLPETNAASYSNFDREHLHLDWQTWRCRDSHETHLKTQVITKKYK